MTSYTIAHLSRDEAGLFRHLTFPSLGADIERLAPAWFMIAALAGNKPVGLAIASPGETAGEFVLKSISVAPMQRRQRIGRALLRSVEAELVQRKGVRLSARFISSMKKADAFVALARAARWSEPRTAGVSLVGEAGRMAQSSGEWPGLKAWLSHPGGFTFEAWRPLTDADQTSLARLRAQRSFRSHLDFTRFAADIDPACSLHVRRSGELLGWVAATAFQGATVTRHGNRIGRLYRSAYIDENLWRTAALVAAYHHAVSRQGSAYGNDSIATYFTEFPGQMALTRRRFAPIALSIDEIHEVSKSL